MKKHNSLGKLSYSVTKSFSILFTKSFNIKFAQKHYGIRINKSLTRKDLLSE